MKFNCGLTWQEQQKADQKWHRFFCWWPTRFTHYENEDKVIEGSLTSHTCAWLETVERKGLLIDKGSWDCVHWDWSYRPICKE